MNKVSGWAFALLAGICMVLIYIAEKSGKESGYVYAYNQILGESIGPRVAGCKRMEGEPIIKNNEVFCLINKY